MDRPYAVKVYGPEMTRLESFVGLVAKCVEFSMEFKVSGLELVASHMDDTENVHGRILCPDKKNAYILAHYLNLQHGYKRLEVLAIDLDSNEVKILKTVQTPTSALLS